MRKYVVNIRDSVTVVANSEADAVAQFSKQYAGVRRDVMYVQGLDNRWYSLEWARVCPELFPRDGEQLELPLPRDFSCKGARHMSY